MKKVFLFLLFFSSCLINSAQKLTFDSIAENIKNNRDYQVKKVVHVKGTNLGLLFGRAMEALSDFKGPDGMISSNVDYQDKESGTIIFKGRFSLGFKNIFWGNGWDRYADFTLKVKCKDERAQVTVSVLTITAVYNSNGIKRQFSIGEWLDAVEKAKGDKRKRAEKLFEYLGNNVSYIMDYMTERLQKGTSEDDF